VKPHVFHSEAGEEYARAVDSYVAIAPELGGRFYDDMERLIREVRGSRSDSSAGIRRRGARFPANFLTPWCIWISPTVFGSWPSCMRNGGQGIGATASNSGQDSGIASAATAGQTHIIEAAPILRTPFSTSVGTGAPATFLDPAAATNPCWFYCVRVGP
jgi:hypothetical protein